MHNKIKDRIDFQINNRYEMLEMFLCVCSFFLIPILMWFALPLFPLNGINEIIDIIEIVVFGFLFYFTMGLKFIYKHIDRYSLKLLLEEDLSEIKPIPFNTRWRKTQNKFYQKLGYVTTIDLKTNNIYISKNNPMNNNRKYHILDLEIKDKFNRKLFLAQEVKENISPNTNTIFTRILQTT